MVYRPYFLLRSEEMSEERGIWDGASFVGNRYTLEVNSNSIWRGTRMWDFGV
jgi:hypothetical protein